jgi:hypothetical protein
MPAKLPVARLESKGKNFLQESIVGDELAGILPEQSFSQLF